MEMIANAWVALKAEQSSKMPILSYEYGYDDIMGYARILLLYEIKKNFLQLIFTLFSGAFFDSGHFNTAFKNMDQIKRNTKVKFWSMKLCYL